MEAKCSCLFDYALINGYCGEDRVGNHKDDEPEIDQTRPIASVSFGATRDFYVYPNKYKNGNPELVNMNVKNSSTKSIPTPDLARRVCYELSSRLAIFLYNLLIFFGHNVFIFMFFVRDLLIMKPGAQRYFFHCVPPRRKVNSRRFNMCVQ